MLPKKLKKDKSRTIVASCVTLIIGILFCCSKSFGNGLDWLIGLALCLAGALYIINAIIKLRSLFNSDAIFGLCALSFGIMFIVNSLSGILIKYVLYVMVAFGVAIIVEAFLSKFFRYNSTAEFIITLIVGILVTALAFCLKYIPGWDAFAAVVFGCILIAISLYTLITLFISRKKEDD